MAMSSQDNDLLTRVEKGAAMGQMLAAYWHPVARSQALEADGAPLRVRLLGKPYVAFRAGDGRVGVFDEGCPHRGVSLSLAHNHGNALRCIFHGWAFDVSGQCVYVPTEPPEKAAAFAASVKVNHYPVREAGGLVWMFPGAETAAPPFPDFEFNHLPEDHVDVRIGVFHVNWVQAMEAVLDSAHLGQLHRSSLKARTGRGDPKLQEERLRILLKATAPRLEIQPTAYGFREGALRELPDGARQVNLRQFVAPYYSFLPAGADMYKTVCMSVALDDEWTAQYFLIYHPDRPLTEEEKRVQWLYAPEDPNDLRGDLGGPENLWRQDRGAMRAGHASGFPGVNIFQEDFVCQESMGPIVDRTREHLGSSDIVIQYVRDQLLASARAFADGGPAWGQSALNEIDYSRIRAGNVVIDASDDWRRIDPQRVKAGA